MQKQMVLLGLIIFTFIYTSKVQRNSIPGKEQPTLKEVGQQIKEIKVDDIISDYKDSVSKSAAALERKPAEREIHTLQILVDGKVREFNAPNFRSADEVCSWNQKCLVYGDAFKEYKRYKKRSDAKEIRARILSFLISRVSENKKYSKMAKLIIEDAFEKESEVSLRYLGRMAENLNQVTAAQKYYEQYLKIYGEDDKAQLMSIADFYLERKHDYKKAALVYDKILTNLEKLENSGNVVGKEYRQHIISQRAFAVKKL